MRIDGETGLLDDGCVQACLAFINDNTLTRLSTNTTNRTAEILAQHCDILLQRSDKYSDDELRDAFSDAVST